MFTRLSHSLVAALAGAVMVAACAAPPADLDLSLAHPSRRGDFVVRLEPPAQAPALNQIHTWQVKLTTPAGTPVSQATIGVEGGMPQHGHGFPTRPRVTREIAPGLYALEGVKFSMTGWWDVRLAIRAGDVSDTAVFNVVVTDSGLRR